MSLHTKLARKGLLPPLPKIRKASQEEKDNYLRQPYIGPDDELVGWIDLPSGHTLRVIRFPGRIGYMFEAFAPEKHSLYYEGEHSLVGVSREDLLDRLRELKSVYPCNCEICEEE